LISDAIRGKKVKQRGRTGIFAGTGISRDIRTVFDIGANVGDMVRMAYESFPQATIHAFEPVDATYRTLCANVASMSDRVRTYRFGFMDTSGPMEINISSFHGASSVLRQSEEHADVHRDIGVKEVGKETIEVRRLDQFVEESAIGTIDLVKIDVEGVELQVLKGGRKALRNDIQHVMVELSFLRSGRRSKNWIEVAGELHDAGFMLIDVYDVAHYEKGGRTYTAQLDAHFSKE
jgi:FkbM family methyltransferase